MLKLKIIIWPRFLFFLNSNLAKFFNFSNFLGQNEILEKGSMDRSKYRDPWTGQK